MPLVKNIRKALRILSREGWRALVAKGAWKLAERRDARRYAEWIRESALTPERRDAMRSEIDRFARRPLISVIVPVYDIDERWLRLCIGSVKDQIYENWELCIADDKSPSPHVREVLDEFAAEDSRIKVVYRAANGHISAASNSALELAEGEFCVLLDHDDELSEDALFSVAKVINDHPEASFIYSDEDLIDAAGNRFQPKFKPDFSRDLLYSLNMITHLSAYRTDILRRVGGFRLGAEGSQDYDLALRVLEIIDEHQIVHIPKVLYHWRAIRGSVAFGANEKPYAYERAREAIREHLDRCGKKATVSETVWNLNRVSYELPKPEPMIRIVLFGPSTDDEKIGRTTDYPKFETVSVADGSPAALNDAALGSDAQLICFLDARLAPLNTDWLGELAGFAIQPEIGTVGAKLVDEDGIVSGGGLIFGGPDLVRAAHALMPRDAAGNMCRNSVISNYSAVSVHCFMIRRELFEEFGGFDDSSFGSGLFDADLCLRIREKGLRIVVTPYSELRGNIREAEPIADEIDLFRNRWPGIVGGDPFYNPNLALTGRTFSITVE